MASIRKRTWQSGGETKTAWVADYFDQDRQRHIKTFPTKKAADAWLVTGPRRGAAGRAYPGERQHHRRGGGRAVAREERDLEKLERSTLRQYRNHVVLHIKPLIGGEKLARLSSPMIESFRDALLSKGSRAMARKVLASLKSILGEAQRRGLVAHNAAQPVKVGRQARENAS